MLAQLVPQASHSRIRIMRIEHPGRGNLKQNRAPTLAPPDRLEPFHVDVVHTAPAFAGLATIPAVAGVYVDRVSANYLPVRQLDGSCKPSSDLLSGYHERTDYEPC